MILGTKFLRVHAVAQRDTLSEKGTCPSLLSELEPPATTLKLPKQDAAPLALAVG
jgi:hypothetical protein